MSTARRLQGNSSLQWAVRRALVPAKTFGLSILLLIGLIGTSVPSAAQGGNTSFERAVNRAGRFLDTDKRARATLNYVHFGTDYRGQRFQRVTDVSDDGAFSLVFRLFWNDDGYTDIAYLCNSNGGVYGVRIVDTNAEGNAPFFLAKLSIVVLGNLIIKAYEDKLSSDDRRTLQKLVDDADPKGMLEWSLKLDQYVSGG